MTDPKELAKSFVAELLRKNAISEDATDAILDAVIYGYNSAIHDICDITRCDSLYLMPNTICSERKK